MNAGNSLRILHLEDDPDYSALVKGILEREGWQVESIVVTDISQFMAALKSSPFDIILADYSLPTCTGIDALRAAQENCPEVPFLVVSGTIGEEAAIEGLRAGATDYVLKLWPERLEPAIRRAVQEAREHAQRREVQEALRESEIRFRTLFEFAPDGIYLCDLQGTFVDGNRAAQELVGYPKEELIGKSFQTLCLLSQSDLLRASEALDRNAKGEATGPDEFILTTKDGRQVPVEIRTFPIKLRDKPLVLGVARDIRERKQLEAQLRHAQKMEGIGQLAGGVAHDFNNLIAVMRGNAELLLMEADQNSHQTNECLKQITGAAERAAALTRQLLIFSRKEAMKPEPLALNDLVRNLTKMLKRLIREDIRLEC